MLKAISSLFGDNPTSDPSTTMAYCPPVVFGEPRPKEDYTYAGVNHGVKAALGDPHHPSGYTSLPDSSSSILSQSTIAFVSNADLEPDVTSKAKLPKVLAKSTDGSLRLYESSQPFDASIDEKSQAQQEREQKKACHDGLNAVVDALDKTTVPPNKLGWGSRSNAEVFVGWPVEFDS